ncbi:MAG TPA: rhodanese-like domain-containing protein [Rugosibacter sp.]|nr:rhodanese-like domain-containing protein [Rugosibacter sp.]
MQHITAPQLHAWLADPDRTPPLLVDVREPWEFALCQIPGSINLPMQSLPTRYPELDQAAEIVMICHHGARSFQSGLFLENAGYSLIINLQGGVAAWAQNVDPSMPTY